MYFNDFAPLYVSSYYNYRGFLINCHQKIYSPRKLRKVSAQALKKATSKTCNKQSHDLQLGRGSYGRYGREGVTGEGSVENAQLAWLQSSTLKIPALGHLISAGSLLSSGGRDFPFKLTLHLSYGPMGEASLLEVNVGFCFVSFVVVNIRALVTYTTKHAGCFLYQGVQGWEDMGNTE